jgi:acyl-homoserine-lactone acylase
LKVVLLVGLVVGATACSGGDSSSEDSTADSLPVDSTVVDSGTGTFEATIRRTSDGVPHIVADDLRGVFFGQGYASAQDHGCSLADQMLKVQSRRAAELGPGQDDANINSDFAWLSIGIDKLARADYVAVPDDITEQFEAFAAGWNAHLEAVGTEGMTGWCKGADWVTPITGEDLYAYARSIALNASSSRLASYIATAQPPESEDLGIPTVGVNSATTTIASNGWAVGSDLVEGGQGAVLVANPHFPWEGELRFWEVHLTVPGELDIYGANLTGVPGIGIGFTEEFAWSHTVSAGARFTAYTLQLDPETPTWYYVDGQSVEMEQSDFSIDVLQPDGSTNKVLRRMYFSEYGPILDFPGVGWTESLVITYRDANIDNDEFILQYADMARAKSFDEFVEAHRTHQGVPLFNTIAVSKDGRAWYADTSATPNLSAEAEAAYRAELGAGGLTTLARQSGAVLLDGSNSLFRWEEQAGSRDPGLVPWEELPQSERRDFVFNANDSFWVNNGAETLNGAYSILHGEQGTARSLRTRENVRILTDTSPTGFAGADGKFSSEELRNAALGNTSYPAWMLRESLVERCTSAGIVPLSPVYGEGNVEILPQEEIDLSTACEVLSAWDGTFNLDAPGAPLFREWIGQFPQSAFADDGILFAEGFDPADPANTPRGLAESDDPTNAVIINLARAVQILRSAGFSESSTLRDTQFAARSEPRIPVHGGLGSDGVTNIVSWGGLGSSTEDVPTRGERVAPGSTLTEDGYPINYGTSFIMVVDFTEGSPRAWAFLTYSNTGDRTSDLFNAQMQAFSDKEWRSVLFDSADIDADSTAITVRG